MMIRLNEYSQKLINQLMVKFKPTTDDSDETILQNINDFEKFKESYPENMRDIQRITYKNIKYLNTKFRFNKSYNEILKYFIKTSEPGVISLPSFKMEVRKYIEMRPFLLERFWDYKKFGAHALSVLVYRNFYDAIMFGLTTYFSEKNPYEDRDQLSYYISRYIDNYDTLYNVIPSVVETDMSFDEFEHLIDANVRSDQDSTNKSKIDNIPILYLDNNLTIFAPTDKSQCIRLRHGRSWCISREEPIGNLYEKYRLGAGRTMYFVIDEDLPTDHVNYACVLLVDPNNNIALADGSNRNTFSGHENLSWSTIVNKLPKLANLKHLFVPRPFNEMELKELKLRDMRAFKASNLIEFFGDEETVATWMELTRRELSNEQYRNLTEQLKKLYISLGFTLNADMVANSEPSVMRYYTNKKIDDIKTKTLEQLTFEDLILLSDPLMKELKTSLKSKYSKDLTPPSIRSFSIDNLTRTKVGKFITLYGVDDLFNLLPETLESIEIDNSARNNLTLELNFGRTLSRFKNLQILYLNNCVAKIDNEICELKNLAALTLINNPKLTNLPDCIFDLPKLNLINVTGSNIPKLTNPKLISMSDSIYIVKK